MILLTKSQILRLFTTVQLSAHLSKFYRRNPSWRLIAELHSWEGVNTSLHQGGIVIHLKAWQTIVAQGVPYVAKVWPTKQEPPEWFGIGLPCQRIGLGKNVILIDFDYFYIFPRSHSIIRISCKFSLFPVLGIYQKNVSIEMLVQIGWIDSALFPGAFHQEWDQCKTMGFLKKVFIYHAFGHSPCSQTCEHDKTNAAPCPRPGSSLEQIQELQFLCCPIFTHLQKPSVSGSPKLNHLLDKYRYLAYFHPLRILIYDTPPISEKNDA